MDKEMLENNERVLHMAQHYPFHTAYICPVCKLLTIGKATSWHSTVHGEQEKYYQHPNFYGDKD